MLYRAVVAASWLLVSTATGATIPTASPDSIEQCRLDYLKRAKTEGMCRKFATWPENLKRPLVVPCPEVLAPFDVCVAKNEFMERLPDRSGDIFCQGLAIHLMADAMNHLDSKSFVDRASNKSGSFFNQSTHNLVDQFQPGALTVEAFLDALNGSTFGLYKQPGRELQLYQNKRFPSTPAFIAHIRPQARMLRGWIKIVHHYWNNLDRTMIQKHNAYLLPGPGSDARSTAPEEYSTSAIRLEHPFVIAGGRFREQYYWDSFFVMEGLLAANMSYLARTTLLNFMDQIKAYGFIPNGARKYYLNRSQPPLFIHMLHAYVHSTKDTHILHEALPLAERELRWWDENRAVKVQRGGRVHTVYQYRVKATGPRPESYAEDWRSAWCDRNEPPTKDQETMVYSELASGAESGWDYTARWMRDYSKRKPTETPESQMKYLRLHNLVPVDLNSIIYRCHVLMAHLYNLSKDEESPFAGQHSEEHTAKAKDLRSAILALHWNGTALSFFDYVLHSPTAGQETRRGQIGRFWSGASLTPFWSGIWPPELDCTTPESPEGKREANHKLMGTFSGIRELLKKYPGPLPATLVESGQQWDFPNSWPPLQYIAIKALENIDEKCIRNTTTETFSRVPPPGFNLGSHTLPKSPQENNKIDFTASPSWRDVMIKTVVMRYISATYCTWSINGTLPSDRVESIVEDNPARDAYLAEHPGYMFEKLNATSPHSPGGGGEYTVQTGFGWTNGVAIWIAERYGAILEDPQCPAKAQPSKEPPKETEQLLDGPIVLQPETAQVESIKSALYGLLSSFMHVLA